MSISLLLDCGEMFFNFFSLLLWFARIVEKKGPWCLDDVLFMVRLWYRGLLPNNIGFQTCAFFVHTVRFFWEYHTLQVARKIVTFFGRASEVQIWEYKKPKLCFFQNTDSRRCREAYQKRCILDKSYYWRDEALCVL